MIAQALVILIILGIVAGMVAALIGWLELRERERTERIIGRILK